MSKRKARIARKEAKLVEQAEKSARLRTAPLQERQIRTGADPGSVYQMEMTWTCEGSDCDGSWSWGISRQWSDSDWSSVIEPKLMDWSKLTWGEIDNFSAGKAAKRHKMHHTMPTEAIVDEAITRLEDIDRYDDTMFRFRLGNRRRLWGFRIVSEFHIVWFDPEHDIYPTEPN